MKKIVVIGGGTGTFVVLSGLKKYTKNISAIVNMSDNGRSTGRLRDELGVLPPGDIRSCLVALSETELLRDLFNYRFQEGKGLAGHNFGNLFLTALEKITGNFERAVEQAAKVLAIEGEVIPSTTQNVNLYARLENGQEIKGQTQIDKPLHNGNLKIEKVWLRPKARATKRALRALKEADLIVIGPGDLYTSIIPNFLVAGITTAIKHSVARKIYICNLMTKFGETNDFSVQDFAMVIEKYLGRGILNYVIFNEAAFPKKLFKAYAREKKFFVKFDLEKKKSGLKYLGADLISHKTLIRHDPDKLARIILNILHRDDNFKLREY
ncbi:MAG: gluconeogenesis factor YvcK family protein [Patescibacteria group bacterium]